MEATEALNMRLPHPLKERLREEAFKQRCYQQDIVIEALNDYFRAIDRTRLAKETKHRD